MSHERKKRKKDQKYILELDWPESVKNVFFSPSSLSLLFFLDRVRE